MAPPTTVAPATTKTHAQEIAELKTLVSNISAQFAKLQGELASHTKDVAALKQKVG